MENQSKTKRLYALAEQDHIYSVWKKGYEDSISSFKAFVQEQPEDVQKFLCGYADCGRMMMQRIINIACKEMEFIEDRE